ncbi:MAG: hypothetical protein ABEI57_00860, partial [Halapricum sp.]
LRHQSAACRFLRLTEHGCRSEVGITPTGRGESISAAKSMDFYANPYQRPSSNSNDKPPYGWTAVNYGQPKSNGLKEWTGGVDYNDDEYSLRKNYQYTHNTVYNWSASDPMTKFTGGWIGNCMKGRQWQYKSQQGWACGSKTYNKPVKVDFSRITGIDDPTGSYNAELKVDETELDKIKTAYDLNDKEFNSNVYIQGMCWKGSQDTMPSSKGEITAFRQNLKIDGKPDRIDVEIPARSGDKKGSRNAQQYSSKWDSNGNLNYFDINKYSCIWGFKEQTSNGLSWAEGTSSAIIDSKAGEVYNRDYSKIKPDSASTDFPLFSSLTGFWTRFPPPPTTQ